MTLNRNSLFIVVFTGVTVLGLWFFRPTHQVWLLLVSRVASFTIAGSRLAERLFTSDQDLGSQLTSCEDDRAHLTALLAQSKIAEAQLNELSQLLHVTESLPVSGQVAHVIFRAVEQDPATVLIDKGSADGLAPQDVILAGEGFLFGTVTHVSRDTATVRLLLHPESQIPVMTQGSHEALGVAVGTRGALLDLRYIPKDVALDEGDVVVTNGREGVFPPNILLGVVENIERDERNPFYKASIALPADPLIFSTVFVLHRL